MMITHRVLKKLQILTLCLFVLACKIDKKEKKLKDEENIRIQNNTTEYLKLGNGKIVDTIEFSNFKEKNEDCLIETLNSIAPKEINLSNNDIVEERKLKYNLKGYYLETKESFSFYAYFHQDYGLIYAVRMWDVNVEYEISITENSDKTTELKQILSYAKKHKSNWLNNNK